MPETLKLDDYRELLTVLDSADAALTQGAGPTTVIDFRAATANHLGLIRDAVENCLLRDHRRLGFASEKGEAPANDRPFVNRQVKLTPDETETVRHSSGPARQVAERFGISISRVGEIRRGMIRH